MSSSFLIAAARVVDGRGSLDEVEQQWNYLREQGARAVELTIDPLHAGWNTPVEVNHFRSGCGPIDALAHACELIRSSQVDAVRISGCDDLRSRYAADKQQRQQLMAIYSDASLPEAYTLLARAFMQLHQLDDSQFEQLAHALYENYVRTAQRQGEYQPPRASAFEKVTDLFRAVDCANPVVDFAGTVIVASEAWAQNAEWRVEVLGVGVGQCEDGPANAAQLARYEHLAHACRSAGAQAGIDLAAEFGSGRALLEAYTCFPVVPLAFLHASGIARSSSEWLDVIAAHEITVTGGMNIARAPWNNPALNGLIAMCDQLREIAASQSAQPRLGIVHGNGGLGYRQGVAILGT